MYYFVNFRKEWRLEILRNDTNFTNTSSFIILLKEISACSKMFVECMVCFGEHEASPNTKKMKRTCIESFGHFDIWTPEILHLLVTLIPLREEI